jgi:hypothetical protein
MTPTFWRTILSPLSEPNLRQTLYKSFHFPSIITSALKVVTVLFFETLVSTDQSELKEHHNFVIFVFSEAL